MVRIAWDCNELKSFVLLDKKETKNEFGEYNMTSIGKKSIQSVPCTALGRRQVTLKVDKSGAMIFSDGVCQSLTIQSPFNSDEDLYVSIGANPPLDTIQSRFYSLQMYGPPSNVPSPQTKDNIHDDFTRYGGDVDPDMWTTDLMLGSTIRSNCGSAKMKTVPVKERLPSTEKALYFGGPNGQRFATTTQFDFSRGGTIEFWMRMGFSKRAELVQQESAVAVDGESSSPSSLLEIEDAYVGSPGDDNGCAYMYDNDGVVLQVSS
jgi:hypothetical protein